jgi:hypothetical protein
MMEKDQFDILIKAKMKELDSIADIYRRIKMKYTFLEKLFTAFAVTISVIVAAALTYLIVLKIAVAEIEYRELKQLSKKERIR